MSDHPDGTIIYSAGLSNIDACQTSENLSLDLNVHAPTMLSIESNAKNCRFVYLSTDQVFGDYASSSYSHHEDDVVGQKDWLPCNRYGEHKGEAEQHVRIAKRAFIVRTQWLYGGRRGSWFDSAISDMRQAGGVRAFTDYIGTPTRVSDFAQALVKLLEDGAKYPVYHLISHGCPASRADIARFMAMQLGLDPDMYVFNAYMSNMFRTPRPKRSTLANTHGPQLPDWRIALAEHIQQTASLAA